MRMLLTYGHEGSDAFMFKDHSFNRHAQPDYETWKQASEIVDGQGYLQIGGVSWTLLLLMYLNSLHKAGAPPSHYRHDPTKNTFCQAIESLLEMLDFLYEEIGEFLPLEYTPLFR